MILCIAGGQEIDVLRADRANLAAIRASADTDYIGCQLLGSKW